MKEKKKPKANIHPSGGKQPRSPGGFVSSGKGQPREAPARSAQFEHPAWQFQMMDFGGPFCPSKMDAEMMRKVHRQLAKYEKMRWQEIVETHQNHYLSLDKLSGEARHRLEEIQLDDTDELFSLRIEAKPRVIGLRKHAVLQILWWDPQHKVSPSTRVDN